MLLSIDKAALEEALDDFVRDRLRKYNLKKYPQNYDQLCHNYVKEKEELRRNEERKIAALKAELAGVGNELHREKITSIIRIFQNNIREN